MTPTEIFARTGELYYHWSGLETSLNGDADQYSEASYKALEPLKESITKYWDSAIEKMGGQIPNEKTINKHLEADKEISINQQAKIGVASTIEPIGYGYQPSLFDDANRNRETTDTIKIPHQDSAHEYRVEPLELETIAAKYGGREVDWEKIAQYAPTQDDSQKTRNHQYDVDYPQPEMSSFDGIHI